MCKAAEKTIIWKKSAIVAFALLMAVGTARADNFAIEFGDAEFLRFQDNGNIVLSRGWIVENARLHSLTAELNRRNAETGGVKEFVVRSGYTENTETIVALIDEKRGNLYLRGQATQVALLQPDVAKQELVIRSGGIARAIVDEDGNLKYRGTVTEGTATTERQNLTNQYATFGYNLFTAHADYVDTDDQGETIAYKFVNSDMYVSPGDFAWDDLTCNHTGLGTNLHPNWQWDETVAKLFQLVRDTHGSRIDVTSGFRCPAYNEFYGTSTSKHAYGRAFDFKQRDPDNNWAEFPDTPAGRKALSEANWAVAEDAASAGVDPDRILLYPSPSVYKSYAYFIANNYGVDDFPNNLPATWTKINNGHCDTGQPNEPDREPR